MLWGSAKFVEFFDQKVESRRRKACSVLRDQMNNDDNGSHRQNRLHQKSQVSAGPFRFYDHRLAIFLVLGETAALSR